MATASLLVGALAFAGHAQAAVTHDYLSQITEVPASAGAAVAGPLSEVNAMTPDAGNLWVAEHVSGTASYRVDRFDGSGTFVSQFSQFPGIEEPTAGIAVGHATGQSQLYLGGVNRVGGEPEGVLGVFDLAGSLLSTWSGADTPSGTFGPAGVQGVAVDNSNADWAAGDVYVVDGPEAAIDVFKPESGGGEKYVTQLTGPEPGVPFTAPGYIAVNGASGEVLVNDQSVVDVFRPTGLGTYELVRQLTATPSGPFGRISGVAVDSGNGDIYVPEGEAGLIDEFNSEGEYLGRLSGSPTGPFGTLGGLAVDPTTHRLYVGVRGEESGVVDIFGPNLVIPDVTSSPVSELTPTSATLHGTVNPHSAGAATCQFVWGEGSEFGHTAPCSSSVPEGGAGVAVRASLSGLEPDTTYEYRLEASNADGTNHGEAFQDQEFTTPGPGIRGESVSSVTGDSAALNAELDPHGAPTSYYFQYGTSTGYGAEVPAGASAAIGSTAGAQSVSQPAQGLLAGTTYHYRVVAVSELSPGQSTSFDGPDQTFTTQPAATGLPDGRAWEMVSPPDKHSGSLQAIAEEGVIMASRDGGAIAYLSYAPTEVAPQGYSNGVQVFSTRGPQGWGSQDIATRHTLPTGASVGGGDEYRFFSNDLASAIVEPQGPFTPQVGEEVSPLASERTIYRRADRTCQPTPSTCYTPLITKANVPPGTEFGGNPEVLRGEIRFQVATPDASHVVVQSRVPLTSTPTEHGLYEWAGGQVQLVSLLPNGEPAAGEPKLGYEGEVLRHAVSDDGGRLMFSATTVEANGPEPHLYMREIANQTTVQVDVTQRGASGEGVPAPHFQSASSDGSKVFFTDTQRLTVDSGGLEGAPDLYEFDAETQTVTDLTPAPRRGERAAVQGGIVGASEDGSYVYFVANGVLASGASAGACGESAPRGATCDLYVRHDGVTTFIAALSAEDEPDWINGSGADLGRLTARTSPGGRWLAFMSQRSLTGYDNRDAISGEPDEEVYLYDAQSNRMACASCNPTGARPVGSEYGSEAKLVGGDLIWRQNAWLAANIPGWTPLSLGVADYQSRYLSDSGRLFFNSHDGLVPQDVNGTWDVYQYEPPGVGNCSTKPATYSPRSGGCVGLISSGTSPEESAFLDASESGADVFFLTTARLSARDFDSSLDVYDAHECTLASPCIPAVAAGAPGCSTADSCKPPPAPQPAISGAPASAALSTDGNLTPPPSDSPASPPARTRAHELAAALKACAKRPKRVREACKVRARKRYGVSTKPSRHRLGHATSSTSWSIAEGGIR
jgi:hypothetical protein